MRNTNALFAACISVLIPAAHALAADWPQFGYDATHSGNNPAETVLTATTVKQLVSLFPGGATLPAKVDSAPVYQSNVVTSTGTQDLLFALTSSGSTATLLAIDAASGATVWSKQTSGKQPTTSSPAIDPNQQFVYSYGVDGMAHKYAIGSGNEVVTGGWPEVISLKTDVEKVASGLTIASSGGTNFLVVVTDGYIGDGGNYQGHLVSMRLATGAQTVFNVMCSDRSIHFSSGANDCAGVQSGIWGRGGATFDTATDRVYIATGNGQFNANSGGSNWGDSVLALAPDGSGRGGGQPRDSYTPANYQNLQDTDTDLGSISMAVLPVPAGSAVAHLGMQVGKDAKLRLIDLDDMSQQSIFVDGFDGPSVAARGAPGGVGGEVQLMNVPQGGDGMREQPAVWVNPLDNSIWLFVANHSGISGLQLGLDGNHRPLLTSRWTKLASSTSPIIANGMLYNAGACTGGGTCISARNPLTGSVLWSSPTIGAVHWQSPILVNGALYITDNNAKLWKFGLN